MIQCRRRVRGIILALITVVLPVVCGGQQSSTHSAELPEMIVTAQGFIAIDTPKGWERKEGPGLAFFLRKGDNAETARVWIYISSAPIGPDQEDKDAESYIDSDIAGFKNGFPKGSVEPEDSIELPQSKARVPVYTFRSAEEHNAFEQIVYIPEIRRVLILALSAKDEKSGKKQVAVLRDFARSYRGSIVPEPSAK